MSTAVLSQPGSAADHPEQSDDELLALCRLGDTEAYAELFRRHRATAIRVALATNKNLDAEDVASEAFTRVWSAIRHGKGPEHAFRPYLLTAVRNIALNHCRDNRENSYDPTQLPESIIDDEDSGLDADEAALILAALATLPDRWQNALLVTEVEEQPVAALARKIGATPNAAAVLCSRARDGLRSAWLQAHVKQCIAGKPKSPECEWVVQHMAAHTRHRLPAGQERRMSAHLKACDDCLKTTSRLAFIGRSLKAAILVTGSGASLLSAMKLAGATAAAGDGLAATGPVLLIRPSALINRVLQAARTISGGGVKLAVLGASGATLVLITVSSFVASSNSTAESANLTHLTPPAASTTASTPSNDNRPTGVMPTPKSPKTPSATSDNDDDVISTTHVANANNNTQPSTQTKSDQPQHHDDQTPVATDPEPVPSAEPTATASGDPSAGTEPSTTEPTSESTATTAPSTDPNSSPSAEPTATATADPTTAPTPEPSLDPTTAPTPEPSTEHCWIGNKQTTCVIITNPNPTPTPTTQPTAVK